MKIFTVVELSRIIRIGLLMTLFCISAAANAQNIMPGAQTGTIQFPNQHDGYITISGRDYNFDNEISKVFMQGEPVDSAILDEGLVVRYTLTRQGVLERIEIIGPASKLRQAVQDN